MGSEFFPTSFEAEDENELKNQLAKKTKEFFRPEFLNRLDDIIIFERLSKDNLGAIVDVQIDHLNARLREKNMHLTLSDKARSWFVKNGFSPEYGARPLKRLLQNKIQDKIADGILAGNLKDGASLQLDAVGDQMKILEFSKLKKLH